MVHFAEFIQRLNQTKELNIKVRDQLFEGIRKNKFDAAETFVSPGNRANSIYYIQSGIVRGAIEGPKEKATTWFKQEGDVVIPQGVFTQKSSEEYIYAVIKSTLLSISMSHIQKVMENNPELLELLLLLVDDKVKQGQQREKLLRISSAKDRYNYLFNHEAYILNRVPHYLIASYINVTKETFSRLHKGLSY
jgi:CRP-like cAMP-binding protein